MVVKTTEKLKELASIFPVPLYIVGGAVRDSLLGYAPFDIDITSALTPDEVTELLSNSDFRVKANSPKLGTLKISASREEYYEYTTFRTDSYSLNGTHSPTSVKYTTDLNLDAKRRDFTINAIYFDIKNNQIVDPSGGMTDLKNKIIKTTREPDKVFSEDGLRLLRMVRFACTYGFDIDKDTMQSAEKEAHLINSLSPERVRDEFQKIIVADTKFGVKEAHVRAVKMLLDTKMMEHIIPELPLCKGVEQRPDFHKYDVLGHILSVFSYSPPEVRMAALLHDIAKPILKAETGHMKGHDKRGAEIAERRLNALKFPKDFINQTKRLVEYHMYDLYANLPEKEIRIFVQQNNDVLDKLILLKDADHLGSGILQGKNPSGVRLQKTRADMQKEGVPFSVKELKVDGNDLIENNIMVEKRGIVMQNLLKDATMDKSLLSREGQLNYIKNYQF